MSNPIRDILAYRELLLTLVWKDIMVRYKQAFLGVSWAVIRPVMLVLIFSLIRSFVGIDTGGTPYLVLTFAALLPWTFFQEAATEGVHSVVANSALVRKIYFPREIFPLAALIGKLPELAINCLILFLMMLYFRINLTAQSSWVPLIICYTALFAWGISMAGAAINVFYRDAGSALPVALSLLMYASPIIYPLSLVENTLLVRGAAGEYSEVLFRLYTINPLTGIIDSFQRAILQGQPPDFLVLLPGLALVSVLVPLGYLFFKKTERYFADVI